TGWPPAPPLSPPTRVTASLAQVSRSFGGPRVLVGDESAPSKKRRKTQMTTIRRTLSMTLATSLVLGSLPVLAAEKSEAQPIRASVERVVEQKEAARTGNALTAAERHELAGRTHALAADPVAGQGGGGAAKMLLISLVTAGISLGTYYVVMKKVKEQTKPQARR